MVLEMLKKLETGTNCYCQGTEQLLGSLPMGLASKKEGPRPLSLLQIHRLYLDPRQQNLTGSQLAKEKCALHSQRECIKL